MSFEKFIDSVQYQLQYFSFDWLLLDYYLYENDRDKGEVKKQVEIAYMLTQ